MVASRSSSSAAPAGGRSAPRAGDGGSRGACPRPLGAGQPATRGAPFKGARILAVAILAAGLSPALAADALAVTAGAVSTAAGALGWIEAGAQPCAELCDARWALDRMRGVMPRGVHAEFVRRIDAGRPMSHAEVVTGDLIVAVSYARAGIPLVDLTRRVAQFPEGVAFAAEGHSISHDGLKYRFVRVQTWDNWALIIDGAHPAGFASPAAGPVPLAGALAGGSIGGAGGGGGGGGAEALSAPDPEDPDILRRPPPTPTPVPLPGGLALLAGGVALLASGRLRRRAPS